METILNYLDNMFINLPQTPEVLRAKEDLAEMMEDKYNELLEEGRMQNEAIGIVISEFGNIQELIDELGIADENHENGHSEDTVKNERFTEDDFQKKDVTEDSFEKKEASAENGSFEKEEASAKNDSFEKEEASARYISALEADEYLFLVKQASIKIAAGVFLCICSPVLLLILGGAQEYMYPPLSDGLVAGLGITVLLCMVACAVGLFITTGMKMDNYEYMKKECFYLEPAYEQSLRNTWDSQKSRLTFKITLGVILCILSVIPVIVCSAMVVESNKNEFLSVLSIACLMVMVAIAVFMFITGGMEEEAYKVILQEKEFSARKKSGKKKEDMIAAIYWPLMVMIYLGWSFASGKWGITWIIWPCAGIIFDIICKIIESTVREK